MNRLLKRRILISVLLFSASFSPAQDLPKLPNAPEITTGTLQNGAEYFLVRNARESGLADFALVRQMSGDGGQLREALMNLPHFTEEAPFDFLVRHGIGYGPEGYVSADGHFESVVLSDVPVSDRQVCDSTLLMIFDMMSLSSVPQAVIVSGDIDVGEIRERSDLLSLMASSLKTRRIVDGQQWVQHDTLRFVTLQNQTGNSTVIKLIYSSARMSRENMNTILPFVTGMYAEELGDIVGARLRRSFRREGIPIADYSFTYKDSSCDLEDERFTISMVVPQDKANASMLLAGSVLGTLGRNGVSGLELQSARTRLEVSRMDRQALTNSGYLDKCMKSYMYGSDLASSEHVNSLIFGRGVLEDNGLGLFNDFASALLDSEKNLVLRVDSPDPWSDDVALLASFRLGWTLNGGEEQRLTVVPTRSSPSRIRLTSEAPEPISGGTLWTFSNGVRVIFKHENTPGKFKYAFFMNGGYSSVGGAGYGESAFTEDMFPLCDFNGVKGKEILETLASKGITMDATVSPSSFCLSGSAPSSLLSDLFGTIQGMSSGISADNDSYRYYIGSETLREDAEKLYPRDVRAIADSIFSPAYPFAERKEVGRLGSDFNRKAAEYFHRQLSRINDGVIVLAGDFQAEILKKEFPRYLGGFPTARNIAASQTTGYSLFAGTASRVTEASSGLIGGKELGVSFCMSAKQTYNNKERMAFRIASLVVRKELVKAMAPFGYYVRVSGREENYPKGIFTLFADFKPCRQSGLPAGIEVSDQISVLAAVRNAIGSLKDVSVSESYLKAMKSSVGSEMMSARNDLSVMFDMIEARYCEGMDLVTGAQAALDSVSAEDVEKMLKDLAGGSKVEYAVL